MAKARHTWKEFEAEMVTAFGQAIGKHVIKRTKAWLRRDERRSKKAQKGEMGFKPTRKKGCDPDENGAEEPGDPVRHPVGDEEAIADMEEEKEEEE